MPVTNSDTIVKITDLKLVNDKGIYYLDLTFTEEDIKEIREINVPRIYLGACNTISICSDGQRSLLPKAEIDLGFGYLPISRINSKDGTLFTSKVIKTKTQELTIAEIEKKLGYKIKIVNEK